MPERLPTERNRGKKGVLRRSSVFSVKLTGPGTVDVLLDDPDANGSGSIGSLQLAGTTTKSKLLIAVKRGGDRDPAHVFNPTYNATNFTLTVA